MHTYDVGTLHTYNNDHEYRGHFWSKRARPGQFWSKRASSPSSWSLWTKKKLPTTLIAPTIPHLAPDLPSLQVFLGLFIADTMFNLNLVWHMIEYDKVSGTEGTRLRFGRKWEKISLSSPAEKTPVDPTLKPQKFEICIGILFWLTPSILLSGMIW